MKKTLTTLESPITGGRVFEVEDVEEKEFRKEKFTVHVRYYSCEDTGEQFTGDGQESLFINELYGQWRVRHGVPFPDEIRAVRVRYGMSYTQMSKILGFGVNQWKQYEDGVVPSESNGKMIKAVGSKSVMLAMLENSHGEFSEAEYAKLHMRVEGADDESQDDFENVLFYGKDREVSTINGFGPHDSKKVAAMVKCIVGKCDGICPTKLNKLMFYSDFYHYRKTGRSISGLKYRAIQYGPVPEHYDTIYDNIAGLEKHIEILSTGEAASMHVVDSAEEGYLQAAEEETIETILSRFGDLKTKEIVDMSHQEAGWIDNEQAHAFIDYSYAFDMTFADQES